MLRSVETLWWSRLSAVRLSAVGCRRMSPPSMILAVNIQAAGCACLIIADSSGTAGSDDPTPADGGAEPALDKTGVLTTAPRSAVHRSLFLSPTSPPPVRRRR